MSILLCTYAIVPWHDSKSQIITSDHYYCVSGKVNSADKLYLVIESVKRAPNTARIRSYISSGRRGTSAHELTICGGEKTRNRDLPVFDGGRCIRVSRHHRRTLWLTSKPAKLAPLKSALTVEQALRVIRERGLWVRPSEKVRACSDPDDDTSNRRAFLLRRTQTCQARKWLRLHYYN